MFFLEKQRDYVQRDTDEVKGRALVKALTGARLARAEAARVANIVVCCNCEIPNVNTPE